MAKVVGEAIKNIIITSCILIFVGLSSNIYAAKHITSGNISGEAVWRDDTIFVDTNIIIEQGGSLSIDTNVNIVMFTGYYSIRVQGSLIVTGEKKDSIKFTINDTTGFTDPSQSKKGGWGGIRFEEDNEGSVSSLKYCILQYAKDIDRVEGYGGAIHVDSYSDVTIANCRIQNNYARLGGGIYIENSPAHIINTYLINNRADDGGGIYCSSSDNIRLINNIIAYNRAEHNNASGSGVVFKNCNSLVIMNNNICYNYAHLSDIGGGIAFLQIDELTIKSHLVNNIFYYNENNLDTTIIQVYLQIELKSEIGIPDLPSFSNCIIQNGEKGIQLSDNTQEKELSYIESYGNVPEFEEPEKLNFYLKGSSKCIDAGIDRYNLSTNPERYYHVDWLLDVDSRYRIWDGDNNGGRIVDIGAVEYGAPKELDYSYTVKPVTTKKPSNGILTLNIKDGVAPYNVRLYNYLEDIRYNNAVNYAVFDSLNSGYYNVSIVDADGHTKKGVVNVSYKGDVPYSIFGRVYTSEEALLKSGYVLAFKEGEGISLYESAIVVNGSYSFEGIDSGSYYLHALPTSDVGKDDYPSYYVDYLDWKDSYKISTIAEEHGVDINLNKTKYISKGLNNISGRVFLQDTLSYNKFNSINYFNVQDIEGVTVNLAPVPAKNIPILLMRDNSVVAWTLSGNKGEFKFSNLSYGEYMLNIQRPGYVHVNNPTIDLKATSINKPDSVGVLLWKEEIITELFFRGIDNYCDFFIYPNPVRANLIIDTKVVYPLTLTVRIFNEKGSLVLHEELDKPFGTTLVSLNVQSLKRGFYSIEINKDDCSQYLKIVKEP